MLQPWEEVDEIVSKLNRLHPGLHAHFTKADLLVYQVGGVFYVENSEDLVFKSPSKIAVASYILGYVGGLRKSGRVK